jgi:hypothetical protein
MIYTSYLTRTYLWAKRFRRPTEGCDVKLKNPAKSDGPPFDEKSITKFEAESILPSKDTHEILSLHHKILQ